MDKDTLHSISLNRYIFVAELKYMEQGFMFYVYLFGFVCFLLQKTALRLTNRLISIEQF